MAVFFTKRGKTPELLVLVEITGSGDSTYCYVKMPSGDIAVSPTSVTLEPGNKIICVVSNNYAVSGCGIWLNDTKVVNNPESGQVAQLELTLKKNTHIQLQYAYEDVPGVKYEYGIIHITEE